MASIIGYAWQDLILFISVVFEATMFKIFKPRHKSEVSGYPCGYV